MSAGPAPGLFTLHHLQGTNPVTYAVDGWVAAAREVAAARAAAPLLLESQKSVPDTAVCSVDVCVLRACEVRCFKTVR